MSAPHHEHRRHAPTRLGFAVLTISDSRGEGDDRSGDTLVALATGAGHDVVTRAWVRDDGAAILAEARRLTGTPGVDVLVTTGGTGVSPRDVTFEALRPWLQKELPGFGELFRRLSFDEVGSAAMASRASAGSVGRALVFILPGSPGACQLAMERLVLPEAAHLVGQLRRK